LILDRVLGEKLAFDDTSSKAFTPIPSSIETRFFGAPQRLADGQLHDCWQECLEQGDRSASTSRASYRSESATGDRWPLDAPLEHSVGWRGRARSSYSTNTKAVCPVAGWCGCGRRIRAGIAVVFR
jgi:hypothetical protein